MLPFFKYHGLGNDFLILEKKDCPQGGASPEFVRELCSRHRGVGGDGILVVDRLPGKEDQPSRVEMVIFNRDGSRPEMCGNGVRCVAAYAVRRWGLASELIIESDAGPRACEVLRTDEHRFEVAVEMGELTLGEPGEVLKVGENGYSFQRVDVGNPHGVIFEMPDLDEIDQAGRLANQGGSLFPEGVNLEFVALEEGCFRTVVYERGVGRTEACGTGACAVAAAAWAQEVAPGGEPVEVLLPGGPLQIEMRGEKLWMTGAAEELFSGVWRPGLKGQE